MSRGLLAIAVRCMLAVALAAGATRAMAQPKADEVAVLPISLPASSASVPATRSLPIDLTSALRLANASPLDIGLARERGRHQ